MKGFKVQYREIGTARDGGSRVFEFEDRIYFLDYKIGSDTRGVIFHGPSRDGLPVNYDLHNRIAPYLRNPLA